MCVPYAYLPSFVVEKYKEEKFFDLGRCAEYGAKKYGRGNWLLGITPRTAFGSLMRHLIACERGEVADNESGLPHIAHALFNAMMLRQGADHDFVLDLNKNGLYECLYYIHAQIWFNSSICVSYIDRVIDILAEKQLNAGYAHEPRFFNNKEDFISEGHGSLKDLGNKILVEYIPIGAWKDTFNWFFTNHHLEKLVPFIDVIRQRCDEGSLAIPSMNYETALSRITLTTDPIEKLLLASELAMWEVILPEKEDNIPVSNDISYRSALNLISLSYNTDKRLKDSRYIVKAVLEEFFV